MLTEKQLNEIREHLENAKNPLFFFDNDVDGMMSFVLLRRMIGRGAGFAIKSSPELDKSYANRIDEFSPVYFFVLDKPMISQDFFRSAEQHNIPIVWIDHHDIDVGKLGDNVYYYNPIKNKEKLHEPISYIVYKISRRKQDNWISLAGCIGDNFLPEFISEVAYEYPELLKRNIKSAFEVLYNSEFGKIISIISSAMKDRTTNVVFLMNFLFKVNSPIDILTESESNCRILDRYKQINHTYEKLLEKAKRVARSSKRIAFFQYGGELSMSSDIANELSYRFPSKI